MNASQRQNSIVRLQMPAQSPVTLVRIAVEPDMLGNKVLESLQQRPIPAFGAQERGCLRDASAARRRSERVAEAPHELVMVHLLRRACDAGPWRKIVRVAFLPFELLKLSVVGIEPAGDFKILAKLNREEVVGPCEIGELTFAEAVPVEFANLANDALEFPLYCRTSRSR